jgi:hypothetical protein
LCIKMLHFALSFNISTVFILRFPYFADTIKRGIRGVKDRVKTGWLYEFLYCLVIVFEVKLYTWWPFRSHIRMMFYEWRCNYFYLVFGRRHWSLSLVVRNIECFTSRTINILCHKNYATYLWFFSLMIHFHFFLWNMLLKEVECHKYQTVKKNSKYFQNDP